MTISRRSFLKGSAVGSAASLIGPGLLAQAAVAGVTEQGVWKTAGSHWGGDERPGEGRPGDGNRSVRRR